MKVAIVGAGIAGLACAKRLTERGIAVEVFDKGRRPGGRLSTLQIEGQSWDFGAPFVRVTNPQFAAQVQLWEQAGVIARWTGGPAGAWVGVPRMSTLIEAAAQQLPVRFGAQVQRIDRHGSAWSIAGPDLHEGPFSGIVLAVPCEQAATLLSVHDLMMAQEAASVRSVPCWSVMAAFAAPLHGLPDVVGEHGPIRWAARNNSKPGRGTDECWVIHGESDWSQQNLEMPAPQVAQELLAALAGLAGQNLPEAQFLKAHRWRFALPMGQRGKALWNPGLQLGACGDWCVGPRIEGAWRSGVELAEQIASGLTSPALQPAAVSAVDAA